MSALATGSLSTGFGRGLERARAGQSTGSAVLPRPASFAGALLRIVRLRRDKRRRGIASSIAAAPTRRAAIRVRNAAQAVCRAKLACA